MAVQLHLHPWVLADTHGIPCPSFCGFESEVSQFFLFYG